MLAQSTSFLPCIAANDADTSSKVERVSSEELEDETRQRASGHRAGPVDPQVLADAMDERQASANGRVEGATRDAPGADRTAEDREADRQTVEGVAFRGLGRGGVENDGDESKSPDHLDNERSDGIDGSRPGWEAKVESVW